MNWREDAACLGYPFEWWFPKDEQDIEPKALSLCAECPVRKTCEKQPGDYGIFGGVVRRYDFD